MRIYDLIAFGKKLKHFQSFEVVQALIVGRNEAVTAVTKHSFISAHLLFMSRSSPEKIIACNPLSLSETFVIICLKTHNLSA